MAQKVRDRAEEINPEDLTPEGRYNNYMKVAKQLIDEGMDPEKVAHMPIHFFLEIVNSRVKHKKKATSFAQVFG
ncbi:phage tail assembly chaperone GT [Staphylococcus chromogenes]|uniref:phage tail assembly chaperone GT n=1 Tax=Staphylococcus chromogenes TaxID=46126 RepID=UPI001EFE8A90|nr:hypothetical protein [Staphylococcus chromogenes]